MAFGDLKLLRKVAVQEHWDGVCAQNVAFLGVRIAAFFGIDADFSSSAGRRRLLLELEVPETMRTEQLLVDVQLGWVPGGC